MKHRGGFAPFEPEALVIFDGTINSCLKTVSSYNKKSTWTSDTLSFENCDLKVTSHSTKECLKKNKANVLDWPSQSTDPEQ